MILHCGSQLHPTVCHKLNYSLIDLVHNSPDISSRSCDKAVAGRAQCPPTSDDLLQMVVSKSTDFPEPLASS